MLHYVSFNTQNREALRTTGLILCFFGGFSMIYSIVSFAMFAHGMTTAKFVFLFLSSIVGSISGILLISKATMISSRSIEDRRYHYFVVFSPIIIVIIIIVIIEELYNCNSCVAASGLFVIICVLCFLALLIGADFYKRKTSGRSLQWEDLDRWGDFKPLISVSRPLSDKEKQEQVEKRLQQLSETQLSQYMDEENKHTEKLLQAMGETPVNNGKQEESNETSVNESPGPKDSSKHG
jgi:hypothetical protein